MDQASLRPKPEQRQIKKKQRQRKEWKARTMKTLLQWNDAREEEAHVRATADQKWAALEKKVSRVEEQMGAPTPWSNIFTPVTRDTNPTVVFHDFAPPQVLTPNPAPVRKKKRRNLNLLWSSTSTLANDTQRHHQTYRLEAPQKTLSSQKVIKAIDEEDQQVDQYLTSFRRIYKQDKCVRSIQRTWKRHRRHQRIRRRIQKRKRMLTRTFLGWQRMTRSLGHYRRSLIRRSFFAWAEELELKRKLEELELWIFKRAISSKQQQPRGSSRDNETSKRPTVNIMLMSNLFFSSKSMCRTWDRIKTWTTDEVTQELQMHEESTTMKVQTSQLASASMKNELYNTSYSNYCATSSVFSDHEDTYEPSAVSHRTSKSTEATRERLQIQMCFQLKQQILRMFWNSWLKFHLKKKQNEVNATLCLKRAARFFFSDSPSWSEDRLFTIVTMWHRWSTFHRCSRESKPVPEFAQVFPLWDAWVSQYLAHQFRVLQAEARGPLVLTKRTFRHLHWYSQRSKSKPSWNNVALKHFHKNISRQILKAWHILVMDIRTRTRLLLSIVNGWSVYARDKSNLRPKKLQLIEVRGVELTRKSWMQWTNAALHLRVIKTFKRTQLVSSSPSSLRFPILCAWISIISSDVVTTNTTFTGAGFFFKKWKQLRAWKAWTTRRRQWQKLVFFGDQMQEHELMSKTFRAWVASKRGGVEGGVVSPENLNLNPVQKKNTTLSVVRSLRHMMTSRVFSLPPSQVIRMKQRLFHLIQCGTVDEIRHWVHQPLMKMALDKDSSKWLSAQAQARACPIVFALLCFQQEPSDLERTLAICQMCFEAGAPALSSFVVDTISDLDFATFPQILRCLVLDHAKQKRKRARHEPLSCQSSLDSAIIWVLLAQCLVERDDNLGTDVGQASDFSRQVFQFCMTRKLYSPEALLQAEQDLESQIKAKQRHLEELRHRDEKLLLGSSDLSGKKMIEEKEPQVVQNVLIQKFFESQAQAQDSADTLDETLDDISLDNIMPTVLELIQSHILSFVTKEPLTSQHSIHRMMAHIHSEVQDLEQDILTMDRQVMLIRLDFWSEFSSCFPSSTDGDVWKPLGSSSAVVDPDSDSEEKVVEIPQILDLEQWIQQQLVQFNLRTQPTSAEAEAECQAFLSTLEQQDQDVQKQLVESHATHREILKDITSNNNDVSFENWVDRLVDYETLQNQHYIWNQHLHKTKHKISTLVDFCQHIKSEEGIAEVAVTVDEPLHHKALWNFQMLSNDFPNFVTMMFNRNDSKNLLQQQHWLNQIDMDHHSTFIELENRLQSKLCLLRALQHLHLILTTQSKGLFPSSSSSTSSPGNLQNRSKKTIFNNDEGELDQVAELQTTTMGGGDKDMSSVEQASKNSPNSPAEMKSDSPSSPRPFFEVPVVKEQDFGQIMKDMSDRMKSQYQHSKENLLFQSGRAKAREDEQERIERESKALEIYSEENPFHKHEEERTGAFAQPLKEPKKELDTQLDTHVVVNRLKQQLQKHKRRQQALLHQNRRGSSVSRKPQFSIDALPQTTTSPDEMHPPPSFIARSQFTFGNFVQAVGIIDEGVRGIIEEGMGPDAEEEEEEADDQEQMWRVTSYPPSQSVDQLIALDDIVSMSVNPVTIIEPSSPNDHRASKEDHEEDLDKEDVEISSIAQTLASLTCATTTTATAGSYHDVQQQHLNEQELEVKHKNEKLEHETPKSYLTHYAETQLDDGITFLEELASVFHQQQQQQEEESSSSAKKSTRRPTSQMIQVQHLQDRVPEDDVISRVSELNQPQREGAPPLVIQISNKSVNESNTSSEKEDTMKNVVLNVSNPSEGTRTVLPLLQTPSSSSLKKKHMMILRAKSFDTLCLEPSSRLSFHSLGSNHSNDSKQKIKSIPEQQTSDIRSNRVTKVPQVNLALSGQTLARALEEKTTIKTLKKKKTHGLPLMILSEDSALKYKIDPCFDIGTDSASEDFGSSTWSSSEQEQEDKSVKNDDVLLPLLVPEDALHPASKVTSSPVTRTEPLENILTVESAARGISLPDLPNHKTSVRPHEEEEEDREVGFWMEVEAYRSIEPLDPALVQVLSSGFSPSHLPMMPNQLSKLLDAQDLEHRRKTRAMEIYRRFCTSENPTTSLVSVVPRQFITDIRHALVDPCHTRPDVFNDLQVYVQSRIHDRDGTTKDQVL